MKNLISLLCCASVFLCFQSCKKQQDAALSRSQILSSRNWLMASGTISFGGNTTDYYNTLSTYEKDDLFMFKSDGTYQQTEGATKGSPADPNIVEQGTWKLINNDTQIQVTIGTNVELSTIDELTVSTFKVSETQTLGGMSYTMLSSFRAQ